MPTFDALAKVIMKQLYGGRTKCGFNHDSSARHPRVKYGYSDEIQDVPYIRPDNTFHPEVWVGIDFTHKFVLKSDDDELKGRRPVSKEVLQNVTTQLARFFSYYFKYTLSYGKSNIDYDINVLRNTQDENVILQFLNKVINMFITNVSVTRSRTDIGNATITLRDNPNYKPTGEKSNVFLNKTFDILNQIFVPMLPVSIWSRGRLYKDWYFPIFDGYLQTAATSNARGFTNITLTAKDVLELARISAEMINPGIIQVDEFRKQTMINIFEKPLYGLDHMVIFDLMFHGGQVILTPDGAQLLEQPDIFADKNDYLKFQALGTFDRAYDEAGVMPPVDTKQAGAIYKDEFNIAKLIEQTSHRTRQRKTVSWGEKITPYRIWNTQSPDTYTSEFSSRLDILRDVAGMVYYELYVNGYGDIQYHPMRLANTYLQYDMIYDSITSLNNIPVKNKHKFPGAQVVGPEEILDVNSIMNVEELVTFLRLIGVPAAIGERARAEPLDMTGSAQALRYMQRYGYRRREIKNPLFNSNPVVRDNSKKSTDKKLTFLDLAANALLTYANAELHSRTVNMIHRPEIDIALPVIFPEDNNVFYMQTLTHNIPIGGEATTNINANFGRLDKQLPPDLANFILISQKMFDQQGSFTGTVEAAVDAETLNEYEITTQQSYAVPAEDWKNSKNKEQDGLDSEANQGEDKNRSLDKEKSKRNKAAETKRNSTRQSRQEKEISDIQDRILKGFKV